MSIEIETRAEKIDYWLVDMVNALESGDISKAEMMHRKITQEIADFGSSIQTISQYVIQNTSVEWVDESRVSIIEWFFYAKNTLLKVKDQISRYR